MFLTANTWNVKNNSEEKLCVIDLNATKIDNKKIHQFPFYKDYFSDMIRFTLNGDVEKMQFEINSSFQLYSKHSNGYSIQELKNELIKNINSETNKSSIRFLKIYEETYKKLSQFNISTGHINGATKFKSTSWEFVVSSACA